MRMLVTGREGQVVRSLIERGQFTGIEIAALGRPDLDLGGSEDSIASTIQAAAPDVIVSAAAYTFVDKAESEPDLAYAINERGPASIARTARKLGIPVIHLSTDYVFDGTKPLPYVEEDSTNPQTVYGLSKLAGERAVLAGYADSVVLRTAWVYSPFGSNFVKTMLRLAADRHEIDIVSDQRGNPTSALDIADGILAIARNLGDSRPELRGIFHMTGSQDASWAEFAEAIFAQSAALGGATAKVRQIRTEDYPTIARRPLNSRLNSDKLAQVHGVRLPEWQSSLKAVVERLQQER
jgi:dTDP-4-dehydrorhamnose reductase